MGTSYFGELSIGGSNGRSNSTSSGSGSSSKKGKKNNSDKPKQPQRGLGVAQLEKIRLHQQLGCAYVPPTSPFHHQEDVMRVETTYSSIPSSSYSSSSSPSYGYHPQHHHPNIMMGYREMEGSDVRYVDAQSCATTRLGNQKNSPFGGQYATQPGMPRKLMSFNLEDSAQPMKTSKDWCNSMGSSSQYSGEYSNETQELDLDLKLSL